jgi:hypothetical protein
MVGLVEEGEGVIDESRKGPVLGVASFCEAK